MTTNFSSLAFSPVHAQLKKPIGRLLVISLFINILALTPPVYMIQVYNRVLSSQSGETLIVLTLLATVALAVYGMLEALRTSSLNRLGQWFDFQGSPAALQRAIDAEVAVEHIGAQPIRDLLQIRKFIGAHAKSLLDLPFAPIFFIAAFILHFWIGVVTLTSVLVLGLIAWRQDQNTKQATLAYTKEVARSHTLAEATMKNTQTIVAMGMAPQLIKRWMGYKRPAEIEQFKATEAIARFAGVAKFFRMFAQSFVLGVGVWLVVLGELTIGGVIAGSIILARALQPIEAILNAWRSFAETRDAWNRYTAEQAKAVDHGPAPMKLLNTNRISAERLRYVPPGQKRPILWDGTFSVEPGEVCVVLGPSGAGKTTLIKAVAGSITPGRGSLLIDDQDVLDGNYSYTDSVGYLPQSVELFEGTVADNIARMQEDYDLAAVEEAVRMAGAEQLVKILPNGLSTFLSAGGGFLSGGQRQRIGLARALFGKPKLVILDEPDAHLDDQGRADLVAAINEVKETGSSVIIVTHFIDMLDIADTCLVMVNGRSATFGPADEVRAEFESNNKSKIEVLGS